VLLRIFTGCDERNPQPVAHRRAIKNMRVVLRK
jgi:hypothetical protein